MARYAVYGIISASKFIGEFEADSKDEAIAKAQAEGDYHVSICHQCAREIDMGDIYEEQVSEIATPTPEKEAENGTTQ